MGGHKHKPKEKLGPTKSKGNPTQITKEIICYKARSDIPPSNCGIGNAKTS